MKKLVLLGVLSLILFTGCRVVGGGVRVNVGHDLPPAHAPAHGRRGHHMYHYFPDAEFYFDVSRNMYFYLDSNAHWTFSVNLPHRLRTHLHSGYVEVEMESDRPYLKHKHHRLKYKKNKRKYKRKYKDRREYKKEKKSHRKKQQNKKRHSKKQRDEEDDEPRGRRGR